MRIALQARGAFSFFNGEMQSGHDGKEADAEAPKGECEVEFPTLPGDEHCEPDHARQESAYHLGLAAAGNHMRALIALLSVVLAVSSALANQISNGYVLQVHSDGRVVNVPLGHGRQPLVGISMQNTQILTVGVSICCNYSGAEVFTLIVNHQRFTQTVFIGCSDPECPAAVGFFVPDRLRDHPYEAVFRVTLEDGASQEYRFRFVNRQLE